MQLERLLWNEFVKLKVAKGGCQFGSKQKLIETFRILWWKSLIKGQLKDMGKTYCKSTSVRRAMLLLQCRLLSRCESLGRAVLRLDGTTDVWCDTFSTAIISLMIGRFLAMREDLPLVFSQKSSVSGSLLGSMCESPFATSVTVSKRDLAARSWLSWNVVANFSALMELYVIELIEGHLSFLSTSIREAL
jgi:hypothetical protein